MASKQAKVGTEVHKLRAYTFPSKGNQAEDYHLMVNGQKMGADKVRTTAGGGKTYTYFKMPEHKDTNQAYWLTGAIPSGTAVTIEDAPEAAKPAPKPAAAPAAKPAAAASAAQRPAAKAKK